jgi:L-malate glycosyltransferase
MKILFLIDTLKGYGAEKSIVEIVIRLTIHKPVVVHLYDGDDLKVICRSME